MIFGPKTLKYESVEPQGSVLRKHSSAVSPRIQEHVPASDCLLMWCVLSKRCKKCQEELSVRVKCRGMRSPILCQLWGVGKLCHHVWVLGASGLQQGVIGHGSISSSGSSRPVLWREVRCPGDPGIIPWGKP